MTSRRVLTNAPTAASIAAAKAAMHAERADVLRILGPEWRFRDDGRLVRITPALSPVFLSEERIHE